MQQHQLSAAYPAMSNDEFQALKDSIANIGVQNPVVLFEGAIIDGWHRWTAAQEVGVQCPTTDLGDVDPVAFVKAANDARRHLTTSQRALIEVRLSQWVPTGRPGKVEPGSTFRSNAEMAEAAGTTERTISDAKTVASKAAPEVVEAVAAGKMSVKKAAATTRKKREPKGDGQATKTKAKKTTSKKAAKQEEAERLAQEAHGDVDLIDELDQANKEIATLTADLTAAQADDAKAEVIKWRRMYEAAVRGQSEAMDRAHKAVEREKATKRQLMRCGKAVKEDDEFKIAPAVEAMARAFYAGKGSV